MKSEQTDSQKSKIVIIKNLPKPFKILLAVFIGIIFLGLSLKIGNFVYCHTVATCCRPSTSPKMMATQIHDQYEYAIQDMNLGRYEAARQRLEFILSKDPEYPSAREKLLEVENFLKITPTP